MLFGNIYKTKASSGANLDNLSLQYYFTCVSLKLLSGFKEGLPFLLENHLLTFSLGMVIRIVHFSVKKKKNSTF